MRPAKGRVANAFFVRAWSRDAEQGSSVTRFGQEQGKRGKRARARVELASRPPKGRILPLNHRAGKRLQAEIVSYLPAFKQTGALELGLT